MKIDLSRFRQAFFQEAADHVNQMEAALLLLTSAAGDGDALNAIFRAAHSIKGASGTFGLDDVTRFTHRLEELLDAMRQGRLQTDSARVQLLLQACDVLRGLLATADAGAPPPAEAEEMMEKLTVAQRTGEFVPDAEHKLRKRDRYGDPVGCKIFAIQFQPSPGIFQEGMDPLLVLRELSELGTIEEVKPDLSRLPALGDLQFDISYLSWDIRFATKKERTEVQDVFAFVEDGAEIAIQLEVIEGNTKKEEVAAVKDAGTASPRGAAAQRHDSASIRVATEKVDQLINLVGELVIAHSMTVEIANHFTPERLPELQASLMEAGRNMRELQERVMAIRMLPVGSIFARLPRIVYDIAGASGKSIGISWTGEETELDKGVLEGMMDPLTHLVRNAADHGIESCEQRRAAGKPEAGKIHLHARHQSGNFIIDVSDDGQGLNLARIREKAIERGLLSAGDDLTPEQIQAIIFHPGFSTAEQVSEISGRGVGMDVVRRNVEALGGTVTLRSIEGKGTTIGIKLPLTLAVLEGQVVRVGDQTYVLPLVSIVESIQPSREQVRAVAGQGEVVMLRQEPLPLLRLHRIFGVPTEVVEPSRGLVAVVENENHRVALLVDELLNQQQVVIKSLQSNFHKVEGAMGATILGDGRVSLILDIAGLVELYHQTGGTALEGPEIPAFFVTAEPSIPGGTDSRHT
jgi:two-component system chemotaxis sensor kinase CheA